MAKTKPSHETSNTKTPAAMMDDMIETYNRAQSLMAELFENTDINKSTINFDPFNARDAWLEFMENMITNPEKAMELQTSYWNDYLKLWQDSTTRFMTQSKNATTDTPTDTFTPEKSDRRFRADEWQSSAIFNFIKQSYLLTCEHMNQAVRNNDTLTQNQKHKLGLTAKLFADALSPTNFAMTNPEVIKETINTGGENLIRGLENLIEDIKRGDGELKISTTDYTAFEVGKNLATTPGHVVFQNELIQLIQYTPTTDKAFKTPLLIIPPWINKYYILDMRPDNSFIRWAVEQGHTVFVISWVNPDKNMAQKRFEDYMNEGVIASLDQIQKITKEPDANVIGYCLGGTLLSITLSYLQKKKQDKRIKSATFLTTLIDFENSGDLRLFTDEEQLELLDREMAEKGVFEARALQKTFSLLRSNDLIWSFVVNNYLMGKEPFPFDLLYWNDDSTNMPAAMHSFYLRKMYRDNLLKEPSGISMDSTPIDITKIKTPAYFLSAREDHIAPWKATYDGAKLLNSDITFTLAASGHIAGVVNPPTKDKYCYWTSNKITNDPDEWLETTKEHSGSWWPHWQNWIKPHSGEKTTARKIKKPIEKAPGSYVKTTDL